MSSVAALRPALARFWMMPLYMILGAASGTWIFVSAPDAPYTLVLALLTLFYLNLDRLGRGQIVLCGMETHVCVLQTALDLRHAGWEVFVAADAVGSRREASRSLGLERMRDRGVDIVDSEMIVFEWLERAATEDFRRLVALIR